VIIPVPDLFTTRILTGISFFLIVKLVPANLEHVPGILEYFPAILEYFPAINSSDFMHRKRFPPFFIFPAKITSTHFT
jgi:hypothetical protein